MARRMRCKRGEKRFTVLVVNNDPYDSHAGRSFESAMDLALPDRGDRVAVWSVCAGDVGAARLPSTYKKRGYVTRRFTKKRGG